LHIKIHEQGTKKVLAACDSELLGKTLFDGKIEFKVSENFYGGKKIEESELTELLSKHENINLIGEECVKIAIKKGLIRESSIIRIKGVPHAQIFRF